MQPGAEKPALLVRGRWVITGAEASDEVYSDAAVAIVGRRIQELGDWAQLKSKYPHAQVVGSDDAAVLPGLINAHHHSGGATYLQHGVPDELLEPWILSLQKIRRSDPYLSVLLSASRLLRSGVTSVVEVHSHSATAETYSRSLESELRAYAQSGIRVAFATGISTQSHLISGNDSAFVDSLPAEVRADAQNLLPDGSKMGEEDYFDIVDIHHQKYKHDPRVDVWFAPPGPQWVSDDFIQRIAQQADAYDCGVQTHVNESFYEKLYGPRAYGKDTVLHLHDLGVLSPRFSLAHGVWLTEAEIEVLADTGAALSHNPSSNLRLRAGIAPLNTLLASDLTVALGMDGTTLNDDEDMFTEMRLGMRLHRTPMLHTPAPEPLDIFTMATIGGAGLLRKQTELGKLAPGFLADLVVLDLRRLTWPWVAPEADPRHLILMRAQASDVNTVIVDGEIVCRNGVPTLFDEQAAGRELAAKLAKTPFPLDLARSVERLHPYVEDYYIKWDLPNLEPFTLYNSKR